MSDSSEISFPVAAWTWHDGKGGLFSTQIFSNGQILQERKHGKDDESMPQKLGVLPTSDAEALLTRCREAVDAPSSTQAAPEGESYELVMADSVDQKSSRHVARQALDSDATLKAIRSEVLGARKKVSRRWNMWTSAGARWFYLMTAVTLALGLYIVFDMKHDNELQSRAHKTEGTVVDRGGEPYKSEFLMVRLDGESGAPELKIAKYLSHPNWEAARVGGKVDVLYDAPSNKAWLSADMLRWQRDKKTIWMIPGFFLLTAFIGWAWLRRYQIGVYGDGNEYMIHEDRVVTDDKDAAVSRSTLLWFKMFV